MEQTALSTHDTSQPQLDWEAVLEPESVTLFKDLLRLDTTNPPGNEHLATALLAESLREDGIEPFIVESAPGRSNLVARLPANVSSKKSDQRADQGPLLLAGHTDVVPANAEQWTHDPFGAVEADGMIWGRGALDMKNMVTMSAMTMKILARNPDIPRHRDLIFAAVADEEEGCTYGSSFLVNEHADKVRATDMLGEVGGFWLNLGDHTFMPIMIAEKGRAHLRMRASGPPGHGSIPHEQSAMLTMTRAIQKLSERGLPTHMTPIVRGFIAALANEQPFVQKLGLKGLLSKSLEPIILQKLFPDRDKARAFYAMLHNTAVPTIFHSGSKLNLIPDEAICELDGRILPGYTADQLVQEIQEVIQEASIEIEILSESPPVCIEDHMQGDVYDTITRTVARHAPEITCVPYLITGFTDARAFSRLGTRCFGFSPLKLEPRHDLNFSALFHGIDERVPVDGYTWGQRLLFDTVSALLAID